MFCFLYHSDSAFVDIALYSFTISDRFLVCLLSVRLFSFLNASFLLALGLVNLYSAGSFSQRSFTLPLIYGLGNLIICFNN